MEMSNFFVILILWPRSALSNYTGYRAKLRNKYRSTVESLLTRSVVDNTTIKNEKIVRAVYYISMEKIGLQDRNVLDGLNHKNT
jgi:hypothetical protein